ncbi:LysR family transcriptional regulator [Paraburkholderia xenovorans]|uniref:LysR family transcriptional regulator n=1 Tax=Paraburkholderia xenovorans TaxID=36873 RepID=UPI0038BBEE6F
MNRIHSRPDSLDLNLLRVFEAVFRERHLTRAADALALTPSAISHALRRLREHLGDALFVRQGNTMVPTPACHRLAPELFEQMANLRRLLQQWTRFDPASTRQTFRIGMPEAVEMTLFPTLQAAFFEAAPEASLASVSFDRTNLSRLMSAGLIDLAIDVAQPVSDPIQHQPLLRDKFCIVASKTHPLKRAPTLNQYLKSRHVSVSGRSSGIVLEDHALLHLGIQRRVALRCQTYSSAFAIVSASDCLLTMPVELGNEMARPYALRFWPTPFELPAVELHQYWHANNNSDASGQWLRDLVLRVVQERWTGHAGVKR